MIPCSTYCWLSRRGNIQKNLGNDYITPFHEAEEKVNSSYRVICFISTTVFLVLFHQEYSNPCSFRILQHITNDYIMQLDICREFSLAPVDASFHLRETLIWMNTKYATFFVLNLANRCGSHQHSGRPTLQNISRIDFRKRIHTSLHFTYAQEQAGKHSNHYDCCFQPQHCSQLMQTTVSPAKTKQ